MKYIKCAVFRELGKYYIDEYVPYSDNIMLDYQIPDEIRKNRAIPDMYYMGTTIEHKIPFLIIPEELYNE